MKAVCTLAASLNSHVFKLAHEKEIVSLKFDLYEQLNIEGEKSV